MKRIGPLAALAALTLSAMPAMAQRDTTLTKRWVGLHLERPLELEFYGDTMLVVNDRYPLDYRLTHDSLTAMGDTSIVARYRVVLGRLLLETPDSDVVTMSPQPVLARPLTGRWVGDLEAGKDSLAELLLTHDRVARWRRLPSGNWVVGEWERETRQVHFTWADSVEWVGQYDPVGNAILFDSTSPGTNSAVFRRRYR